MQFFPEESESALRFALACLGAELWASKLLILSFQTLNSSLCLESGLASVGDPTKAAIFSQANH